MFQTILVPLDDYKASERALHVAAGLAQTLASKLVLVYIIEPPPAYAVEVARSLQSGELVRAAKEHAKTVVNRLRLQLPSDVSHQAFIRKAERRIWREVLESSLEHHADLIVMGAYGREGLARPTLGSVADRVARYAEVPVMLVR